MKPLREESFKDKLEQNGITRRDFMIWSATITSLLALPYLLAPWKLKRLSFQIVCLLSG